MTSAVKCFIFVLITKSSSALVNSTWSSKPMRMWIDGKVFTLRPYCKITETPVNVESFEVTSTANGQYSTSFRLATNYLSRFWWGFHDFDIASHNQGQNTTIITSKYGLDGNITVTGSDREEVVEMRHRLHSMMGEIRRCARPSNFVSIPIRSVEVRQKFEKFKEELLRASISGIHESIFTNPLKLHLTLVVCALFEDNERAEAVKALEESKTKIIDPLLAITGPLMIQIAGLEYMNGCVRNVRVLYAKAKIVRDSDQEILQRLANDINDFFYERGLTIRHRGDVTLHMTLFNTIHRIGRPPLAAKREQFDRQPVDATYIMRNYKDYYFGESLLDSLHLSYMSSTGDDGYYVPLSTVKIIEYPDV